MPESLQAKEPLVNVKGTLYYSVEIIIMQN